MQFDVTPFLARHEGQYFDRKSLFEGVEGQKKPRDRREVRDQIAEYVAAFANADGGVLILGIEDDRAITGHRYPPDAIDAMLRVPTERLMPQGRPGVLVPHEGLELLVFDVPASDEPVQVVGDGFPTRIGDATHQLSDAKVRALKQQGLAESYEAQPSPVTIASLDDALVRNGMSGAGMPMFEPAEYLVVRKLADERGTRVQLRRAAELLFARRGPDHPNAGVRIFRVIGTERRTGPVHNVEELPRIEGPVPQVLLEAWRVIGGLVRRPSRLVGERFRPVLEYPEFSWKEAVLNAVAHRDYATQGRGVEVWMFDDRMEIVSPGGLVADASLEDLLALRRVHASRNPRLVRALVDLDAMRDQGEGIPRMFAEMEGAFLPTPVIEARAREFRVTLRNTPTLSWADRNFVASLGSEELTDPEFRALLEASRHGRVDNGVMRKIAGLDTLGASQLLRRLRDRGLLRLHSAGAASFYELASDPAVPEDATDDLGPNRQPPAVPPSGADVPVDEPGSARRTEMDIGRQMPLFAVSANTQELGANTQELRARLGLKPRQDDLRSALVALCAHRSRTAVELASMLGRKDVTHLVNKHLRPLVAAGRLRATHPNSPTHPAQAYVAVPFDPPKASSSG